MEILVIFWDIVGICNQRYDWVCLKIVGFHPIDCKESDDDWAHPLDFTPFWRPKCPSCRYFCRNIKPTSSDQAVVDFVGQPAHPDDTIPDLCQGGSHSRSSLQRMWSTVVASEFSIIKYNKHNMVWKLLRKNGPIWGVSNFSTCLKMHSVTAFPLRGLQWQDLGETARGGRVSAARRCTAHLRSLPPAVPCCRRCFGRMCVCVCEPSEQM